MRLFIAEKPSLGRAIAENLGKGSKKEGCIVLNGGDDVVTWCFGHILEQYNPDEYDERYAKWSLSTLPIIPAEWKLRVKKEAKKQFDIIKGLLKQADFIVNAGDPDREGQLLIDEVLDYLHNKKPVRRILLNALDSKSVQSALNDLRPNSDFTGLHDSALARSQADWLVGMNLSRAYTLKAQEAGYDGVFHVGRVQTPTLALVVRREDEIAHFTPTTHYAIQVQWQHARGDIPATYNLPKEMDGLDADGRLTSKSIAQGILDKVETTATAGDGARIQSVETKKKQEGQRLPYSLSTLQVEAGRKYGLSPQQVLDAMQGLYEKKLTTYPRSDCEYLPTNQLTDAPNILSHLASIPELSALVSHADPNIRSKTWNDQKISAHHALIPTTERLDFASLSATEQKLYLMVAKAYLAQFYPIHAYEATKITIACGSATFTANGKTVLQNGWKDIYQNEKKDDKETPTLPPVQEGDAVSYLSGSIQEKVTTPPKRFTDATLLQAMKEIYKYVKDKELAPRLKECKGIGTEATRAGIIETLKKAGFVTPDKKKHLIPTDMGRMAIAVLPDSVTYPDTTAAWEASLDQIADGTLTLAAFIGQQTHIITQMVEDAKNASIAPSKNAARCPNCGKVLRRRRGKNGFFWGCSGYPACKTTLPDKNGKPDFNAKKKASPFSGKTAKCPVCGKNLRQIHGKFGTFWGCEDRNCNATFPDHNDQPVIVKCPQCGEGYLKRAESKKHKGKFFWYCSAKCGAPSVWDKDGLPDLK